MNPFTEKTSKILMAIGIVLFFVGIVLFFWQNADIDLHKQIDSSKFSQFGDYVGGLIGSLWAFAGVILFYVALTEQRVDISTNREVLQTQVRALEQQIKEFELQRQELELTREVFIDQSKTLKLQQFESTFFNSMNLLNNIIESITYKVTPYKQSLKYGEEPTLPKPNITKVFNGRNSFELFYNDLQKEYLTLIQEYYIYNLHQAYIPGMNIELLISIKEDLATKAYEKFFDHHHSELGHYFRTIYNIIKFIKHSNTDNPKYYTNLLRSQLSTYEHLLLFYNCQSVHGKERFKPLIIEYSLLDNMEVSELLDHEHNAFYPKKAYE